MRRGPTPTDEFSPKTRDELRSTTGTSQTEEYSRESSSLLVENSRQVPPHVPHLKPLANLRKQHEYDISCVEVQRRHHVLVEGDKLLWCSVGGEERRDEGTEAPLLQDGLQDAATLLCIALNEHLGTTQTGQTGD